jgi:hypothetical protein
VRYRTIRRHRFIESCTILSTKPAFIDKLRPILTGQNHSDFAAINGFEAIWLLQTERRDAWDILA